MSPLRYESRIASLERAVAFYVMFHAMGKTVADWWPRWTCGLFRYRIDRTHSIMRIATTASPVSGADVRDRMREMARHKQFSKALTGIPVYVKSSCGVVASTLSVIMEVRLAP